MSTVQSPAQLTLRVGDFEGPLDLLLHLARTQEIDLASLPIRTITDQYLAHLEAMAFRDLESAGAYLVMAATLVYLKSKLLVPDLTAEEELDEEGEALRHELEERLREYAGVKAAGAWLAQREAEQALLWGRPSSALPARDDIPLEDLSVHLLERTLSRLIEEQLRHRPREVELNPPSVLERMTEILAVLRDAWSLLFSTLVGNDRRSEIVVSLLAVLELMRLGRIRAQQTELFGEIVIERQAMNEGARPVDSQPAERANMPEAAATTNEAASTAEPPPLEPASAGADSEVSRTMDALPRKAGAVPGSARVDSEVARNEEALPGEAGAVPGRARVDSEVARTEEALPGEARAVPASAGADSEVARTMEALLRDPGGLRGGEGPLRTC